MNTDEKVEFDRKQNKVKKIMGFVVAPILFIIAGLLAIGYIDIGQEDPKPTYVEILSTMELHCYNVNWFGQHGFQVTYTETIKELAEKLEEHDIDFKNSILTDDKKVVDYMVIECPHVKSRLVLPDIFDPNLGTNPIDACLESKIGMGMMQPQMANEYCLQFKR